MSFLANQINLQEASPLTYAQVSDSDVLRKDQISARILELYNSFVDPQLSDHLDTMKEIYEHYSDADHDTLSNFTLSINAEDLFMDEEFGKLETKDTEYSQAIYDETQTKRADYDGLKESREDEYLVLSQAVYDKSDGLALDFKEIEDKKNELTQDWYNNHVSEHDDDFKTDHAAKTAKLAGLSSEYKTMSDNMDDFSTHNTNQLNSIVDFLDSRFKQLSSELIDHSNDVVNTWETAQLSITNLNTKAEASELELSQYVEDIILGHAVPADGIPKYVEISDEYDAELNDDNAKYLLLQGAVGQLKTNMNTAYDAFTTYSHEALSTNTSTLLDNYSNSLVDVMSDALIEESDLSTQTHDMQEYVEGLTAQLIQYNANYDSVNENVVASKNIAIGANWRFKSDTSSLEIQYNPDPTDPTGWQVVPFLQKLNNNAEQLLLTDNTSPVQGAVKPTISDALVMVNSIIHQGPENRSSLRGIIHQLVHNVDYNLVVVGNSSAFMTHVSQGGTFRIHGDNTDTDITALRYQQDGLVFANISGLVSSHNTSTPLQLKCDTDTDGNFDTFITAYYFPFVMSAGNVGVTYQQ